MCWFASHAEGRDGKGTHSVRRASICKKAVSRAMHSGRSHPTLVSNNPAVCCLTRTSFNCHSGVPLLGQWETSHKPFSSVKLPDERRGTKWPISEAVLTMHFSYFFRHFSLWGGVRGFRGGGRGSCCTNSHRRQTHSASGPPRKTARESSSGTGLIVISGAGSRQLKWWLGREGGRRGGAQCDPH